jgi:RHS repeat-associated protein
VLASVSDPIGGQTSYSYDADGDLTSITDPRGHTTNASYNNSDLESSQTDALSRTSSWTYYGDDTLQSYTAPNGKSTSYSRDALGRVAEINFPASSISYTYDSANRPITITDSSGVQYTNTYDDFDDLASQAGPNGTVSYTYDALNRRASLTAPDGLQNTYSYDADSNLTGVTGVGGSAGLTYDADGRPLTTTLPDGIVETYAYDPAGQLSSIDYATPSSQLGKIDYGYDQDSRANAVWGSYSRITLPSATSTMSYDAANELASNGATSYTYDPNGELTNDGTNSYTWDDRGHVTGNAGPGLSASFTYDPLGRRLSKTINGTTTNYLYDGANVLEELSGGTVTAQLLGGAGTDQVFARTTASGSDSYLTDRLGSTIQLANPSGNPTTSYTYDPFGLTSTTGPASTNPYQYTGRENDGDGLQYNRARYYDPSIGRFISQDPLGYAGSGVNLYGYGNEDPIDASDPSGLEPQVCYQTPFSAGVLEAGGSACCSPSGDWSGVGPAGGCTPPPPPTSGPKDHGGGCGFLSCILHAGGILLTGAETVAFTAANGIAAVACEAGTAGLATAACAVPAVTAVGSAVGGTTLIYEEVKHF